VGTHSPVESQYRETRPWGLQVRNPFFQTNFGRKDKRAWIKAKYKEKQFIRKEELNSQSWTLHSVLDAQEGRNSLRQFLQHEFSAENLSFWEEVEELKTLESTVASSHLL
jgi:hypothetical protein